MDTYENPEQRSGDAKQVPAVLKQSSEAFENASEALESTSGDSAQPFGDTRPEGPQFYYNQFGEQVPVNAYVVQDSSQPPKKSKTWLWVLCGCLALLVLSFGGCVGCTACTTATLLQGMPFSQGGDASPLFDEDGISELDDTVYSYSDLQNLADQYGLTGVVMNDSYGPGLYRVGEDCEPGLYFLEGSQNAEGSYFLFERSGKDYKLDVSIIYFGNYFAKLEKGDVIMFLTSNATMYKAGDMVYGGEAPYGSGLYRVGTDIPAGTYDIQMQEDAMGIASTDVPGAFVMKDLDFNDASFVESKTLVKGVPQTVTVEEGDYLELYLATASLRP